MAFNENLVWGKRLANGNWIEVTPLSRGKEVVAIEVRTGGAGVMGSRELQFMFPFDVDSARLIMEGVGAVLEMLEIEGGMDEVALDVRREKERKSEEADKSAIRIWNRGPEDYPGIQHGEYSKFSIETDDGRLWIRHEKGEEDDV